MQASAAAAARFLTHRDPKRRIAAMAVLRRTCQDRDWLARAIRELAVRDPDEDARANAIVHLAGLFLGTRDCDTLCFFARMVGDQSLSAKLQFMAYDALHVVSGKPVHEWPSSRAMLNAPNPTRQSFPPEGEWPGLIDWSFVHSCSGPKE